MGARRRRSKDVRYWPFDYHPQYLIRSLDAPPVMARRVTVKVVCKECDTEITRIANGKFGQREGVYFIGPAFPVELGFSNPLLEPDGGGHATIRLRCVCGREPHPPYRNVVTLFAPDMEHGRMTSLLV